MMPGKKLSIIVIRDRKVVMSGCCGGEIKDGAVNNYDIAALYLDLKNNFGNTASIDMVETTNIIYLVPRIIKDALKYDVKVANALKALFTHKVPSIIINGKLAYNGTVPSFEDLEIYIKNNTSSTGS